MFGWWCCEIPQWLNTNPGGAEMKCVWPGYMSLVTLLLYYCMSRGGLETEMDWTSWLTAWRRWERRQRQRDKGRHWARGSLIVYRECVVDARYGCQRCHSLCTEICPPLLSSSAATLVYLHQPMCLFIYCHVESVKLGMQHFFFLISHLNLCEARSVQRVLIPCVYVLMVACDFS